MQTEDVKKLADLARIDMSEEEMKEVAKDFDSILAYVGQVKEASSLILSEEGQAEKGKNKEDHFLYNVTREDIATNKSGEYRENILANVPETEEGFVKVKQIM